VASFFHEFRTDHDGYENPDLWIRNGGWVTPLIVQQYRFVKSSGCDWDRAFKLRSDATPGGPAASLCSRTR
jgi:hypothetical protein